MDNKKLNIAITGGGTGGHLKIAKVIKDELNKQEIKPIYIGSTKGADREWFSKDTGFSKKYFLNSSGVVNQKGLNKLNSFFNIIKLSFEAKKILKENNIKAVFSVGGYSAAPASFAAIFSNVSLFIHEQNAHIGSLNKLLKPFSKRFFSTFLYNDPYPVEEIFFNKAKIRKEIKTIIFLGGSQGAVAINDLAVEIAPVLKNKNIKIIHQTGKRDYEKVKNFYKENKIDADVFDFSKNLVDKITKADFAISRAGASTLFELVANQIPTIFIPYPYAAGDHQYYNAKFLEEKNAGFVIRQNEITPQKVLNIILNSNLKTVSKNLAKINQKNGAEIIVDKVLNVLSF
jgi:UDP-N-acetylglucosamine--N-acetylmuramyl-(pentapeptide) pyrophosphoryl-undecaprenol N-acetylglucosamine transferase